MKKLLSLVIFTIVAINGITQPVTLQTCLNNAVKNSPLNKQNKINSEISVLQQNNIFAGKLPQMNLNGQVTYQSAVTELPIKVPGFSAPEIPKLQYKITMDANQLIYGGNSIAYQKEIEDINLNINQINNETELYQLRERVNQLYFNILLSQANKLVIEQTIADLKLRHSKLLAGEKNGIVLHSSVQIMEAEILKAEQRLIEVSEGKQALISTLNVITGETYSETTIFAEPESDIDLSTFLNKRPEYRTFDAMIQKLDASTKLITARDLPKVYGFGTAGFGRPGLNMFKEEADFFYMTGIKVTWNFYNWHLSDRERKIVNLNAEILENRKASFNLNTQSVVQQYLRDIEKTSSLLKSDMEIIQLRESVKKSVATQLENGTISVTEFILEQIACEQAYMQKNYHKIQQLQAKWLYKAATGSL